MSTKILFERSENTHMIKRYINFIESIKARKSHLHGPMHRHHILPKAKDMFPEYKNFGNYPWNEITVSLREHFIAHWMLAKIFPGTSQALAFYYMCNKLSNKKSKEYEKCKLVHLENMKTMYTEDRNNKISKALKGKPKSKEHKQKLVGHIVSIETRRKLREANLGKTHSKESKMKMTESRTGKTRGPYHDDSKINISKAKKQAGLKWYNNGSISKLYSEPPEGWVKGRLKWIKN